VKRSGYLANAERAHLLVDELIRRGVPHGPAAYAGHAIAPGGIYYFRGNVRTALDMHRSKRSAQRYRALLEGLGLLRSYLLLRGDMVPGQRAPVRHAHVIRDCGALWKILEELGAGRVAEKPRPPSSARPSVADVPSSAPERPRTAEDFAELGERVGPEWSAYFFGIAAAKVPPNAAKVTPEEIEIIDRELAELERKRPAAPERAPPRGPPDKRSN
jgi:hypothetical protein